MLGGPTLAVFLQAFFNPWSEAIGAIVGYVAGMGVSVWCYIGSTYYPAEFAGSRDFSARFLQIDFEN